MTRVAVAREGMGMTNAGTFGTGAPRIPSYALYGEDHAPATGPFAHIETIAERSALHDWEIRPHRHADFVQILLVREGQAAISLDGADTVEAGPALVIAPAGTVHGFRFRQGTEGYVLTLSADFGARASEAGDPLGRILGRARAGALDAETARRALWLAAEMLALQRLWAGDLALVLALAEALVRVLATAFGDGVCDGGTAPADRRIERFRHLVEIHFREPHDLAFYAASLGMTRRTLSRLTAARLGCTPLDLVHRRRAAEAQRLLRYTGASVAQVAAALGFDDPSYFSRFYLRMTGHRPADERR